jgi:DNA-binding response OmpR family regulator
MKLLVADDCVDIVKILSSFLELSGHEIDEAYDGIEAIELLRNNAYDVVITDAEMPRLNGMDLCKFIKSACSTTYIIGISGSGNALNRLREAGADICFAKPFRIDEIEKTIEDRFHFWPPAPAVSDGMNDAFRLSGHPV